MVNCSVFLKDMQMRKLKKNKGIIYKIVNRNKYNVPSRILFIVICLLSSETTTFVTINKMRPNPAGHIVIVIDDKTVHLV